MFQFVYQDFLLEPFYYILTQFVWHQLFLETFSTLNVYEKLLVHSIVSKLKF